MDPLGVQDADPRRAGMLETADRREARPDKAGTDVVGEPNRRAAHGQHEKLSASTCGWKTRPDKAGTSVIGDPDRGWAKHGQNGNPRGR